MLFIKSLSLLSEVCSPPCNLAGGRCTSDARCECEAGWRGEQCLECTLSIGDCCKFMCVGIICPSLLM